MLVQNGVMDAMARDHPRVLAGLWFGGAALLPAAAMGVYDLLMLAVEGPLAAAPGVPLDGLMAVYLVVLPPVLACGAGALIGVKILAEPRPNGFRSAGWGAVTALLWLAAWVGLGELIGRSFSLEMSATANPSLMAFGYGMALAGFALLVLWNGLAGWFLCRLAKAA